MNEAFITSTGVVPIEKVFDSLDKMTGIKRDKICGPDRTQHIFLARALVCVVLRGQGLSYSQIGSIINRDHTSIMHAVKRAMEQVKVNKAYADLINTITKEVEK